MRNVRHLLVAVLVLVGGVSIACTDAGAPTNPSDLSPSFSTAEQEATKEEREQRHEQLKLLLNLQKERIKKEKELRKGAYELARDEWKEYKQDWKEYRKLLKRSKTGQASTLLDVDLLCCKPRPFEGEVAIIGPDGGTLHIGAHQLTMSYKECVVPVDLDLRLAYIGWGLRILELPSSVDLKESSEVIGDIDHF